MPRHQKSGTPATQTQSGYLYHKEEESAPRRAPPGRHKDPKRGRGRPGESIWPTIRILAIVLGGMSLLLFGALHLSKTSWHKKLMRSERHAVTPADRTPVAEEGAPPGIIQEPDHLLQQGSGSSADSKAIREAVFLAETGTELEEAGDFSGAVAQYRSAIERWPNFSEGWQKLGHAYMAIKEYPEAQKALEEVIRREPENTDVINDLGVVLLLQKQVQRSYQQFQRVLSLDPEFTQAHYNLALCYVALNDMPRARDEFEVFLRLDPGNVQALRDMAFLDATQGQHEQALARIVAALESQPEWAPLYEDAAAMTALMGRHDDCIKYLRRAEALSSSSEIYQLYQQPAFDSLRNTELGTIFEMELASRVSTAKRESEEKVQEVDAPALSPHEPMVSPPPSL